MKAKTFLVIYPELKMLGDFDINLLRLIVRNLLSNAIKFSPENEALVFNTKTEFSVSPIKENVNA